jgi:hypothetical protein
MSKDLMQTPSLYQQCCDRHTTENYNTHIQPTINAYNQSQTNTLNYCRNDKAKSTQKTKGKTLYTTHSTEAQPRRLYQISLSKSV